MKHRIAIWATVGSLVASGWAIYFFVASKDNPTNPIVSTLVRLTCPVAIVGSHYPVSLYSALVTVSPRTLFSSLHRSIFRV